MMFPFVRDTTTTEEVTTNKVEEPTTTIEGTVYLILLKGDLWREYNSGPINYMSQMDWFFTESVTQNESPSTAQSVTEGKKFENMIEIIIKFT